MKWDSIKHDWLKRVMVDYYETDGKTREDAEVEAQAWVETATSEEIFDRFCNWEGLVNYGPPLRRIMQALKEAE